MTSGESISSMSRQRERRNRGAVIATPLSSNIFSISIHRAFDAISSDAVPSLLAASWAVAVIVCSPFTRPVTVQLQVVDDGYVTVPGDAEVFTDRVTVAPASLVPVIVCVEFFMGDLI